MYRFVSFSIVAMLIPVMIVGCGKSNSEGASSASNSPSNSNASAAPSAATPQSGPLGQGQPQSDADAAKSAAASGQLDAAIISARKALWTQPDDKDMTALLQDVLYRQAMQQGNAALASGDLDTVLEAAMVAVLHQPGNQDAMDLLKKARSAIASSPTYFGKYLTVKRLQIPGVMYAQASAGGNIVIANTNNGVDLIDLKAGTMNQFPTNGNGLEGFYDPPSETVIIPSGNGTLSRIDLQGKASWTQSYDQNRQQLLGFSPSGKVFAYCTSDGIVLLDSATGQQTGTIEQKFPTSPFIATYDAVTGSGDRHCFSLSMDGKLGAFATPDGSWSIFDISKGTIIHTFKGASSPGGFVPGAAFGGNARFAYSNDIEVSVRDTATWKEIATIETPGTCEFAADGKVVLVTNQNRETALYDATTGQKIAGPFENFAHVLTPDGQILFVDNPASAQAKGIDAYRVIDGKRLGTTDDFRVVRGIAATPNNLPLFWHFGPDDLCVMARPTWPDDASIKSIPPHALNLPGDNSELSSAIADLKRSHGVELIVYYNENSLPQPDGLQGLPQMVTDPGDVNAHSHLVRYLKDRALMDGTPGFYISIVMGSSAQPYTSAWIYYPTGSAGQLNQDSLTKLSAILDNLTPQGSTDFPSIKLRQFAARLTQDLGQ